MVLSFRVSCSQLVLPPVVCQIPCQLETEKVMSVASQQYKRALSANLNEYGLRYEDLLVETEPAVEEALTYAAPEVKTARIRRMKRAMDLSFKRKNLMDYAPEMKLEPFKEEISQDIKKIQARDAEYTELNIHKM